MSCFRPRRTTSYELVRSREPSVPATVQAPPEQKNVGQVRGGLRRNVTARHFDRSCHESRSSVRLGFPERLGLGGEPIVGIGHPADAKAGHPRESLPFAQVSRERFGRRD